MNQFINRMEQHICNRIDFRDDTADQSFFVGTHVQDCSIPDFLLRIQKYCGGGNCMEQVFLYAMILLDRATSLYKGSHPRLKLNKLNTFNIFGLLTLISMKVLCDENFSNKYYARVIGVDMCILNKFEAAMCSRMDFSFHIDRASFDCYAEKFLAPFPLPINRKRKSPDAL